jgi:hypothetical protein
MSPPGKCLLHMRRESPPQALSPRLRMSSCAEAAVAAIRAKESAAANELIRNKDTRGLRRLLSVR